MKKLIPLLIIAALTLFVGIVSAKGLFTTVTIYNPSTDTTITIHEEDSYNLRQFFLFDLHKGQITNIPDIENGYEIRRGVVEEDQFDPFDMIVYYPRTEDHPAYIHYIGLINSNNEPDGSSEYDNRWYHINSLIENELNRFIGESVPETSLRSNFWQNILDQLLH